ncbi:hypothetical protein Q3G72_006917 [Acer saccharum]|nr:hypothetical protein Q3G72_006917 [Acer saccharum]
MRGYEGDEVEEYDEYEDEYEEDEEGEEEEIEEEERKPTEEELEYLELRKRLKERYRKKFKKESSSALSGSHDKKNRLPYDNYGSFFGPSAPVISQRVIQESKSFLETQHLANKGSHSHRGNEKTSATTTGSKGGVPRQLPKANQVQTKVEKIKVSRDYSFLSDDAVLPATKKDPPARNISRPNSEARSAQLPIKNKQPLGNSGRNVQGAREERKPISSNGQMHSKAGPYKSNSASKPNLTSMDSRKQHSSSNGIGPGRPAGPKPLPSKMPVASMVKKAFTSGAKNVLPSAKVPPSSKMPPPVQKKHLEQRKGFEEPNMRKMVPKQQVSASKPQINKPLKQISSRPMAQDHRPKKKPLRRHSDGEGGDDDEAFQMLRSMLGPRKFANYDDDDDSDMEAGFDDILREESRSARIARKEDEEELRKIEEEERQERMRKMAKKRKLSQRH